MGQALSFEFKQLWRLLDDRQWHEYEAIKSALAGKIPPGRALRRYEERTANRVEREGVARLREPEMSDAKKVVFGARMLAGVTINSMRSRYLDIDDHVQGKRIRLRPGVPAPAGLRDDGDGDELETHPIPRETRGADAWPEDLDVSTTAQTLYETEAVTTPDEVRPAEEEPAPPTPQPTAVTESPAVPETTPEPAEEVLGGDVGPAAEPDPGPVELADTPDPGDADAGEPGDEVEAPVPPEGTEARKVFDEIMEGLGLPRRTPVLPESRLREIVREEVERVLEPALEAFQDGMQIWLMQRFAGLELIIQHSQAAEWSATGRRPGDQPHTKYRGRR